MTETASRCAVPAREEEASRYLADASAILMTTFDYRERLSMLAGLSVPRLADYCVVDVAGEGGSVARIEAAHADPAKKELARELLRYPPMRHRAGGVAEVLRTGELLLVQEVDDELLARATANAEHRRLIERLGLRSTLLVPLTARGRTFGVITFAMAESGRRYEERDVALAREIAHRAAIAIDNAHLYLRAREATRAREEVLGVVSRELRNPLGAMLLTLDLVLEAHGGELSPGLRGCMESMRENADRMVELVDDMTDVVRVEEGELAGRLQRHEVAPLEGEAGEARDSAPGDAPAAARRAGALARGSCGVRSRPGAVADPVRRCEELLRELSAGHAAEADPALRLREWIARSLHLGRLRPGDRLPSIREIAGACGTTKHTIVRVYRRLEEEGIIETRERSGIYLADPTHREGGVLVEAGEWLAGVLAEACELHLRVPLLPDLIGRWTSATRLVCACVESDLDLRTALCGEYSSMFGLECVPVAAEFLGASDGGPPDPADLPPEIREADLLLGTAFHVPRLRPVAKALRKPLVVATADQEMVSLIESRVRVEEVTAICADHRFGEKLRSLYGGPGSRLRVVLASDHEALSRLDPAKPVLQTRAAREIAGDRPFRLLTPHFPHFSLDTAHGLARLVIQLNLAAKHRPCSLAR